MEVFNQAFRIKLYTIFSFILIGLSILLFFHDFSMGYWSLITAVLFLLFYGNPRWIPGLNWPWMLSFPAVPMVGYLISTEIIYLQMGLSNVYMWLLFFEYLLKNVTYIFAFVLILKAFKVKWLRLATMILCVVCIGFGIWDICDGVWVVINNPSAYHVKHFFIYYIPDIFFWLFPFTMILSVSFHKKR